MRNKWHMDELTYAKPCEWELGRKVTFNNIAIKEENFIVWEIAQKYKDLQL